MHIHLMYNNYIYIIYIYVVYRILCIYTPALPHIVSVQETKMSNLVSVIYTQLQSKPFGICKP